MTIIAGFFGGGGTFQPVTRSYGTPGSYTETVPYGATSLTIECWGGGGHGGSGTGTGCAAANGSGAGGGGYTRSVTNALNRGNLTFAVVVGAGGPNFATPGAASSVTPGTFPLGTTMTSNGGTNGGNGPIGTVGVGGSASGGLNVSQTGNNGTIGNAGGVGGSAIVGVNGSAGQGGPGGFGAGGTGGIGGAGLVIFKYT